MKQISNRDAESLKRIAIAIRKLYLVVEDTKTKNHINQLNRIARKL